VGDTIAARTAGVMADMVNRIPERRFLAGLLIQRRQDNSAAYLIIPASAKTVETVPARKSVRRRERCAIRNGPEEKNETPLGRGRRSDPSLNGYAARSPSGRS
jgi:hypothetical protein